MPIAVRPGSIVQRLLPILAWLPGYRREWLLPDVLAGFAVWAVMVPEGMAYADIVGVPPIMGLNTIVPPLIAYALLGTSHRPGHRDWPDLCSDRRRHRGAGNSRIQCTHLYSGSDDWRLFPAVRRTAHGLGGCFHPDTSYAGLHRRFSVRHHRRSGAASAGYRRYIRQFPHQTLVRG
jgi:hypothetical protein